MKGIHDEYRPHFYRGARHGSLEALLRGLRSRLVHQSSLVNLDWDFLRQDMNGYLKVHFQ